MRITVMGIQASGKGTLGARLAGDFCVPHIIIGDLLRERSQIDDEIGRRIAEQLRAGGFADEAVVVQVLAERLAEASNGFVLDGFPRFGRQVDTLDAMLAQLGAVLDAPVHLRLPEDAARKRLADRLVCRKCGQSTTRLVAQEDGPCPIEDCSGTLTHRQDDRDPVAVDRRLAEFRESTMPVIRQYKSSGRLVEVDVSGPTETAYATLRAALDDLASPSATARPERGSR